MKSENIIHGIKLPRLAFRLVLAVAIIALVFAMARPVFAVSPIPPSLGSAANFAVLGAAGVTNTGPTIVTGDLGVSPGTSITGFPPGTVTGGTVHAGDGVAAQAHTDLVTAYAGLVALQCGTNLTGKVLGVDVKTLSPGVYCFNSSAQLTGTLHLSGAANAAYVFQIPSTLTTASDSFVIVDNNPSCGGNVYWQIGSSATLGTGTKFAGNILAYAAITITTHVTISGRALAKVEAVTMDTNVITACGAGIPNGGPCGGDTETGDTDHHRDDDKGKQVGNDSVKDQAQSVMTALGPQHQATHSTSTGHDNDDSNGHHTGDHGHDDNERCSDNQRDNDNDDNVQGTDGDTDDD